MDGDRRKRKNFSMVNRGVQQSGDVPHGWRRDGVSKTSELPTREELLRRMWSLASARANDAVKLAFLPEEQMGAIGKLDLAALTELKRVSSGTVELKFTDRMRALETLVTKVGGVVTGRMAILAEGDAQQRKDIQYLAPLPVFNADGTVK